MANNKLTFSSPGVAKLSWKVKYGDQELDTFDSLTLNMNGESIAIEPGVFERSYDIKQDTTVYMDAAWGEFSARSSKLYVSIISGDMYYGSVVTGKNDDWDEEEIVTYLKGLTLDSIKTMIDKSPDSKYDPVAAHPGKLVQFSPSKGNFFNKKYCFYCADDSVESSRPIFIYPEAYGKLTSIKSSMQTESLDQEGNVGFYHTTISLDGNVYHAYIHKTANAIESPNTLDYDFIQK